ncbi:MAG: hypothetical protein MK291_07505, partial [Planctomycetes bacterium]|nr:hypothetical protein [Planctomycetota bacterium]
MSADFPELPLHPEGLSNELPARDRSAVAAALSESKVGGGELAAVVDLGTNSALLIVGEVVDGELVVVEEHGSTPRLGEGLARTGALDDEAITRTMEVLRHFVERMDINGVTPDSRRFAGTAVLRRASDASRIIERAAEELGVVLEVLPEEEEARLSHRAGELSDASGEVVVVDVGGGSTELAWGGGEGRASIPVGAVVLTETWLGLGGREPIEGGGWEALLSATEEAARALPAGVCAGRDCVLVGGAAVNLACLDQDLASFDVRLAEGREVSRREVLRWSEELAAMDLMSRLEL